MARTWRAIRYSFVVLMTLLSSLHVLLVATTTLPTAFLVAIILVALFTRKTGNRVKREFIDSETGKPVERDDQVKGYEVDDHRYVVLEPNEVAAAVPESDKTLRIEAFIPCDQIDTAYFDKPYYLAPDKMGTEAFVLLRDGMMKAKVAAIARTVSVHQGQRLKKERF